MASVSLGFIGCGSWARNTYLPYLNTRSDVIISGISDLVQPNEKAKINRNFPNVMFFETYQKMFANTHLDGVIVAVPDALHYPAARYALECGVHVMVDKPLCQSFQQGLALVELAKEKNLTLALAGPRRCYDHYKKMKTLISDGKLGDLNWIRVEITHDNYPNWKTSWRNSVDLCEKGLLQDTGYHMVDLIQWMLNGPKITSVFAKASYGRNRVIADFDAILTLEDDLRATLFVSRNMPSGYRSERFAIQGSAGYVYAKTLWIEGNITTRYVSCINGITIDRAMMDITPAYPLKDFIHSLKGHKLPIEWAAHTTLPALAIIDALYTSVITENVVNIKSESN